MHLNILPEFMAKWENHPTYKNAELNGDVGLDIPMVLCPAFSPF